MFYINYILLYNTRQCQWAIICYMGCGEGGWKAGHGECGIMYVPWSLDAISNFLNSHGP